MKTKKLGYEDFIKRAIVVLRKEGHKGIHSVYSGFNSAFRKYYNEDPINIVNKLAKEGKVYVRPSKNGVVLYLPNEIPDFQSISAEKLIEKIEGTR